MGPSHQPEPNISKLEQRLQAALGESYRIQKELGGGGMSRVFLAEETRLGRQVVVKVLPPEMGAAVNIERFEREIQLAARLQHPHVVSLLTAASSGDLLYYIMPYIAGESLRAKIGREGALPVPEAVKVLREIVDALAYAHGHNVVHRDIKPDNVLLSTGHAVVTDFGVAKAVSASSGGSSTLTSLGVALGTPAYMSPEQAAADPHVDHRADIYAVGAMAYEMLTGRTPFTSPTAQGMLAAHITQTPDPLSKHRPNVPGALNTLVMRCLEKHPADRWQTAGDLLAQLEIVLTPSGGMAPTEAIPAVSSGTKEALRKSHPVRVIAAFAAAAIATLAVVWVAVQQLGLPDWVFYGAIILLLLGLPIILATGHFERKRAQARATGTIIPPSASGVHRLFTWQKAIRGGFLAFAGLGVITVVYTAMRLMGVGPVGTLMASGKLTSSSTLVVADFSNRTADTTLGVTLTEAFRIDLAQSRAVKILSSADMSAALDRMQKPSTTPATGPVAQEIAAREGAKAVVAGEISSAGKSYLLVARILDAKDGKELVALRETSPDDAGIISAVDRLSGKVRERIGESLRVIRSGAPLAQVTTSSLEALRLYTEALNEAEAGNDPAAIPLLRRAVEIDSGFAMAWRKLAAMVTNVGGRYGEVVDAATRAFRHRDRLPEMEREATVAYYYTNVDRNISRVLQSYQRILEVDSTNSIATYNRAYLLQTLGHCDQGLELARRGEAMGQSMLGPIAMSLTCDGRFDEARQELLRYRTIMDSNSVGYLRVRAFTLAIIAPDEEAVRASDQLIRAAADPGLQVQAHEVVALVEFTRGRVAAGEARLRTALALAEGAGDPSVALVDALTEARMRLLFHGDSAGAVRLVNQALRRFPLAATSPEDRPSGTLAVVLAMTGQLAEARRVLAEYEAATSPGYVRNDPDAYRARAWIALREGRPLDAVAEIRQVNSELSYSAGHWDAALAFDQAQQPDSAIARYEFLVSGHGGLSRLNDEPWGRAQGLKRLGELYEGRGQREKALENYGKFVDLWKDADPMLQPQVREVKARMAKLAGEPR